MLALLRSCLPLLALAAVACQPATATLLGVQRIDAQQLERLRAERSGLLILDVRQRQDWAAGHIPGAVPAPAAELGDVLADLEAHGRRPTDVVTVCYRGNLSTWAAAATKDRASGSVTSLAGGMRAWQELGLPIEKGNATARAPREPEQPLGVFDQVVATASGVVIKPTYMLMALLLILLLRRAQDEPLRRLRQGMTWFLGGEIMCAVEFATPGSHAALGIRPVDLAHGAGMVAMGALLPWALFRLVDQRVLHLTDPQHACVAQRFCERCWKREATACGLTRLFPVVAAVLSAVSLLPLTLPLRPHHQISRVFASLVDFGMPLGNQVIEYRLYPIAASACFVIATFALRAGPRGIRKAELPFFLGVGLMSFSLMRFLLEYAFRHAPVWADFWEEVTEMGTTVAVGIMLFVFRRQLGLVRRPKLSPHDRGASRAS